MINRLLPHVQTLLWTAWHELGSHWLQCTVGVRVRRSPRSRHRKWTSSLRQPGSSHRHHRQFSNHRRVLLHLQPSRMLTSPHLLHRRLQASSQIPRHLWHGSRQPHKLPANLPILTHQLNGSRRPQKVLANLPTQMRLFHGSRRRHRFLTAAVACMLMSFRRMCMSEMKNKKNLRRLESLTQCLSDFCASSNASAQCVIIDVLVASREFVDEM